LSAIYPTRVRDTLSLLFGGQWKLHGGKVARDGVDHSSPTSAKLKSEGSHTSSPPYALMA